MLAPVHRDRLLGDNLGRPNPRIYRKRESAAESEDRMLECDGR
jgi:hypothetical protein